jgi:predicted alpha/beta superfamily hydrolase
LHHYLDFPSRHAAPRPIDVWLPPGYDAGATRYPVLYMHDGQNVFAPANAFTGIDWGVDEAIERGMATGGRAAIVVGVWNTPLRRREYMPQQPLSAPGAEQAAARFAAYAGGPSLSDAYLRLLVEEVKHFVDATYRTLPAQPDTFVMGSSMGGLVSLYALCQYPQVFGGAGCLSTHWPIGGIELVDGMAARLPPPGRHRIYFDFGTATLDAQYEPFQTAMDGHMAAAGYRRGVDWLTLKFEGAEHTEAAWRARVETPLRFLLGG